MDNRQIGDQKRRVLRGLPSRFAIPVKAGDPVMCEIDLQRYRFARSPVFFRTPGDPVARSSTLLREPQEWKAEFAAWNALSATFEALKTVVIESEDIHLLGTETRLPTFARDTYDAASSAALKTAKSTLLNLHCRLHTTAEPLNHRPWFSFVRTLVAIGRERILAFVDPEMGRLVGFIHDHIEDFRADYERTPAENHRRNVPAELRDRIASMVSIKTSHERGNLQLTITRLANPDAVLLDADIDENGGLLSHLLDVLKHKVTGGTHPHDIHEILLYQLGATTGFDLGYVLV